MTISRISSNYMIDRGIFNIQNNLLTMAKLQDQIASGKVLSRPSDDPVKTTQLLRLNRELSNDEQFGKNIDEALSELGVAETAMTGMVNLSHRARELAVQAANGTNSDDQLNGIAEEIDSLIDQLVQLGNTTFTGRYIFSGFETGAPAFTRTNDDVSYDGTANNTAFERNVQVAPNSYMAVNFNGNNILGNVTVTAGVASGSGLLYDLTKLKLDLQNKDYSAIRTGIDSITTNQQTILNTLTQLGGRVNQLEMTKNRIEDRHIINALEISKIQEINMPEAISSLNFQQNVYQASLGVMSKLFQTSLVNFLR